MNTTSKLIGSALLLTLAHNPHVRAQESALERVEAELGALRSRVEAQDAEIARLRAAGDDSWMNERRAEEVKALVREVLADADTRASLLNNGVSAGYNRGFFIRSEDGNNELRIGLVSQVRYLHNHVSEGEAADGDADDDTGGFQLRRIQVDLNGHFINPKWTYRLRLDSSNGGNLAAAWAWVGHQITDDLGVRWGQLKPSFLHEENVGGPNQLAVERSFTADYFTTDFSQGVQLTWQLVERFKLVGTVHSGSYSSRTDFNNDMTDIAIAGRAEYLLIGDDVKAGWRQFRDFSSWSGDQPAVLLGAAVNHEWGESGGPTELPDVLKWTADVNVQWRGLSLFAAVIGQHFQVSGPAATGVPSGLDDADQFGAVGQVSYFVIPDKLEPFVRYEWIDFDGVYFRNNSGAIQSGSRNLTGDDELGILTVGGNWYFQKHNAKLTLDVLYALDPVPVANTGNGLLRSAAGDQLAFRAQFQFRF